MDIETIKQLGLNDKEALLYKGCIELGPSRASALSKYTRLNRVTIYDVSKSLFKKGLLSSTQKKNVIYFIAQPPRNVVTNLENQLANIKIALPQIEKQLTSQAKQANFVFFEGIEGIKAIYEETLHCKSKELLQFVSIKEMLSTVGLDFIRSYVRKRVVRNISAKTLKDPLGEIDEYLLNHYTQTDKKKLVESKVAPDTVAFPAMMMVYDNNVALMSGSKEGFGFIVESREFSEMMRKMFNVIWLISK